MVRIRVGCAKSFFETTPLPSGQAKKIQDARVRQAAEDCPRSLSSAATAVTVHRLTLHLVKCKLNRVKPELAHETKDQAKQRAAQAKRTEQANCVSRLAAAWLCRKGIGIPDCCSGSKDNGCRESCRIREEGDNRIDFWKLNINTIPGIELPSAFGQASPDETIRQHKTEAQEAVNKLFAGPRGRRLGLS